MLSATALYHETRCVVALTLKLSNAASCHPLPIATMPWANLLLASVVLPTASPSTVPVSVEPTTFSCS